MFLDRSVPRIRDNWDRFGFVGEMKHDMVQRIQRAIDAGACPADMPAHVVFRPAADRRCTAPPRCGCATVWRPARTATRSPPASIEATLIGLQAGAGRDLKLPLFPCDHSIPTVSEDTRHDS
jgi:hypothetical protein